MQHVHTHVGIQLERLEDSGSAMFIDINLAWVFGVG